MTSTDATPESILAALHSRWERAAAIISDTEQEHCHELRQLGRGMDQLCRTLAQATMPSHARLIERLITDYRHHLTLIGSRFSETGREHWQRPPTTDEIRRAAEDVRASRLLLASALMRAPR